MRTDREMVVACILALESAAKAVSLLVLLTREYKYLPRWKGPQEAGRGQHVAQQSGRSINGAQGAPDDDGPLEQS